MAKFTKRSELLAQEVQGIPLAEEENRVFAHTETRQRGNLLATMVI
jgi:hypothetical protein